MQNTTEFLTVREIADRLYIEPLTVRGYISRGLLPSIKIARKHLVRSADFEKFLEKQNEKKEE